MPTGLSSKWMAIARAYGDALVQWASARQRNGRYGQPPVFVNYPTISPWNLILRALCEAGGSVAVARVNQVQPPLCVSMEQALFFSLDAG
jgi:hypothetical protein